MIRLNNVSKIFSKTIVLDNLNLELKPNNIYCFKGQSGSGKTTLLNLISGLDSEYDGTILINNVNLKDFDKKELELYKSNIGYMMQKNLLYKNITILDNLLLIENNKDKIKKLTKRFKVDKYLDKKPTELSGGELQRISLIRALLNETKIIILDEPTSNLDHKNSMIFARFLKSIDITNKIIIIATHKEIYDNIANCIIRIEFGKISIIKENLINKTEIRFQRKKNKKSKIIKLAWTNRHKSNILVKIFLIILLFLIFFAFSYVINYKSSYLAKQLEEIPYNVIDVNEYKFEEKLKNNYRIKKVYDNYKYFENEYEFYPLYDYEDSPFKKEGIIKGYFPKNNNEILVNDEFIKSVSEFSTKSYDEILTSTIIIHNKEYQISGIVGGESNNFYFNFYSRYYAYKDILNFSNNTQILIKPAVFIKYDEIKEYGIKVDNNKVVSFEPDDIIDIYELSDLNKEIFGGSFIYTVYSNDLSQVLTSIKSQTNICIAISIILLVISMFFLINEVSLELYYRKKEIGYLQLFHFTKDDISFMIIFEYLFDFIIDIMIAIIIYFFAIKFIYFQSGLDLILPLNNIILIVFILFLYIYIIIEIPLISYMKEDVVKLIK